MTAKLMFKIAVLQSAPVIGLNSGCVSGYQPRAFQGLHPKTRCPLPTHCGRQLLEVASILAGGLPDAPVLLFRMHRQGCSDIRGGRDHPGEVVSTIGRTNRGRRVDRGWA